MGESNRDRRFYRPRTRTSTRTRTIRLSASLILFNGSILTVSEPRRAAAIAIGDDGRILGCGRLKDVEGLAGRGTRRIDLRGRTVVPGFNDCHMHILPYGLDLIQADLSPEAGVRDVPSLMEALRKWSAENPRA